ncbi:interleukin-13 receptor subunit alpha-1-like isoform X2 [Micropterus salmoides]|uniref:interleukin-13 receptor subunit alpha-1-like isoform X2 n=1 Tax=Micropterus salmoides TaxID=27706 RepID=UPI0018ED5DB5|nr:interleukin-13 receptor subunit alpha-1-like isoform X2 [Micropterus salmoides]
MMSIHSIYTPEAIIEEMCHCLQSVRTLREPQSSTEWRDSRRLAMKLFPVHPMFCSVLLVLWTSQSVTEANNPEVCQEEVLLTDELSPLNSSGDDIEEAALEDNFLCVLYPTNTLNCSWSFHTLQKDTQLSVYISICDGESAVHSRNLSAERVGSSTLVLPEYQMLFVVIHFNVTLHDMWTVYAYKYSRDMLEVLPPPQNISALVKDGRLLVTWSLPQSWEKVNSFCFEYQLDIGDQGSPKNLSDHLFYTEPNVDPSRTYRVRIRTRKNNHCISNLLWSDWSQTVTVEQTGQIIKLNAMVIVSISLGIPMILLAVLLLGLYQRVTKVLYPPIPRPPPKYKSFLEKSDMFNFFHLPLSAEPDAEITVVEDTEQNLGKKF